MYNNFFHYIKEYHEHTFERVKYGHDVFIYKGNPQLLER